MGFVNWGNRAVVGRKGLNSASWGSWYCLIPLGRNVKERGRSRQKVSQFLTMWLGKEDDLLNKLSGQISAYCPSETIDGVIVIIIIIIIIIIFLNYYIFKLFSLFILFSKINFWDSCLF